MHFSQTRKNFTFFYIVYCDPSSVIFLIYTRNCLYLFIVLVGKGNWDSAPHVLDYNFGQMLQGSNLGCCFAKRGIKNVHIFVTRKTPGSLLSHNSLKDLFSELKGEKK